MVLHSSSMTTDIWPRIAFLAVCGIYVYMKGIRRKDITMKATPTQRDESITVVILTLPAPGIKGMPTLFVNDSLILQAVKTGASTVYAYIEGHENPNDSQALKYISEVYTRLWDEMICQKKLYVNCYVFSDSRVCSYPKLVDILAMPHLTEVLLCENSRERIHGILEDLIRTDIAIRGVSAESLLGGVLYYDAVDENIRQYDRLAVGGTFDRLHNGHRKLLTLAAGSCRTDGTLVVGIMSDELLHSKTLADRIHPFSFRKAAVLEFLASVKPTINVLVVPLLDPFGPTVTDPLIEALVVSSETLPGISKINAIRGSKQYPLLAALVVQRSNAATLSSTFIREFEAKSAN